MGFTVMATSDKSRPSNAAPLDLLPVIRRSGILSERQFDELRAKVLTGDYPNDTRALADRLVRDKIITDYQARRFLRNKSHGLLVGQRYMILDRLGSGSMGRVYKAQHLHMGRLVALKIIAPEIASNERVAARFQREMLMVGKLDHPNEAQIDVDVDHGPVRRERELHVRVALAVLVERLGRPVAEHDCLLDRFPPGSIFDGDLDGAIERRDAPIEEDQLVDRDGVGAGHPRQE